MQGDARTLSFPEVTACLAVGWTIVLAFPAVHELSERVRSWALTSSFAFTMRALFFAPHVTRFPSSDTSRPCHCEKRSDEAIPNATSFVALPNFSRYPRSAFFDSGEHLNETWQVVHSKLAEQLRLHCAPIAAAHAADPAGPPAPRSKTTD